MEAILERFGYKEIGGGYDFVSFVKDGVEILIYYNRKDEEYCWEHVDCDNRSVSDGFTEESLENYLTSLDHEL